MIIISEKSTKIQVQLLIYMYIYPASYTNCPTKMCVIVVAFHNSLYVWSLYCFWRRPCKNSDSFMLFDTWYPLETHLILKSREIPIVDKICFNCSIVWDFAQSTTVCLPCSVQKSYKIWISAEKVRDKRDFARFELRCVSDGYPILHKDPRFHFETTFPCPSTY